VNARALAFFLYRDAYDMNDRVYTDMLEPTRLTRAGRLVEATSLLQKLLQGGVAAQDETGTTASETMMAPRLRCAPEGEETKRTSAPDRPPPWRRAKAFRTDFEVPDAALPPQREAPESFFERLSRSGFDAELPGLSERYGSNPAEDPGQFIKGSYSNQAGSRAYKLYIPSGYHGQALPLVVMLHGCTQSPDDFAAGTRMNMMAEERTCFVVYPAQPASANHSKCWNWFRPGHQQRGEGEPSLISGITRQIMRDYPVDRQRVYVAGLSAGAAAAAIMGKAYPDLYAAIGVHSGLTCGAATDVLSAFTAMRRGKSRAIGVSDNDGDGRIVPTIVFHGDRDTTVHPCNGDQVIAQSGTPSAADLSIRVEHGQVPAGHAYSRTLHTDASGQTILEQWVVHGAGHAWSGGSRAGSYTDPRGPDATQEILRFFLEHAHPAAPA
jgi:poly(hydroxyalkanoate) depolymerase family esterase